MIGAVIADEAIPPPLRTERCIARNRDAVADMGDKAGRVLLPVEIDDETGQPCNNGGRLQPRRKQAHQRLHADVDGDMAVQHGRAYAKVQPLRHARSEEHTAELQSLMRTSYAVFCLTKKQKDS